MSEFSYRTREAALRSFRQETFDLLIVGGGITGAATARDAASRGLRVALVEKHDFAWGTSSRSSKLIHGGLRYLQNFEFGLVFEALAERALLLKTAPNLVRPLPFFLPVYQGDPNGRTILSLGLWLYDLLALFRTPGFHQRLSRSGILAKIPFLNPDKLAGGFRYYDASMWDDALAVDTLRAAAGLGARVANYVEALSPIWKGDVISGFRVQDRETGSDFELRAKRVIVCAGPWTDAVGTRLSQRWRHWLNPSKGVHLVFDLRRIPVPGAMVMSHPEDGRIAFVIPRPDMGAGVVIVGTTDGPTPRDPDQAEVEPGDVSYLMGLLRRYFPALDLRVSDILSAYVGVRPLMETKGQGEGASGGGAAVLQKVSREHHIDLVPGGVVVVAGGKYTTHRRMAEEIVDFALQAWKADAQAGKCDGPPSPIGRSQTASPVNPRATAQALAECRARAAESRTELPSALVERYGAESLDVLALGAPAASDPEGFPALEAQLRHCVRQGMVLHLEDFYLRRVALYGARADHGLPWAEKLARVWAEERELGKEAVQAELARLREELDRRSAWKVRVAHEPAPALRPEVP